jgi:adenylosuccinate synthase
VVRFQGGHNAGHTLVVGDKVYKLNLVPSGIVRPGIKCYIGNGVVLDTHHLLSEIKELEAGGIEVRSRLKISPGCPLILAYHSALDRAREAAKRVECRIGTTGKGIGPTYEDKVARRALRVYDLFYPERFAEKLRENIDYHNFVLTQYLGAEAIDYEQVLAQAMADAEQIKPLVCDVSAALHAAHKDGQNMLFEGAQGALLDVDHGTYPFVTSSNCVAGQASAGAGIGPGMLHYVLGITKAYCTRVGGGPFPTELEWEKPGTPGYHMSTIGAEKGVTTGRSRRCGWFDAALLKRSAQVNGLSGLCITKLDVLDGIDVLQLCTGYMLDGELIDILPMGADDIARCVPVYEAIDGWTDSTVGVTDFDALPVNAKRYLSRIEQVTGVPIAMVSTSPDRDHTILLKHPYQA